MGLNRPFYSEMKMLVRKRGCHEPHTVLLRRTKLMRREQVLSDPERFRAYLQETGFWQRAEGLTVVDGGIRVDRGVLRKEFSRLAIYLQLYCQSSSILRLYLFYLAFFISDCRCGCELCLVSSKRISSRAALSVSLFFTCHWFGSSFLTISFPTNAPFYCGWVCRLQLAAALQERDGFLLPH